MQAGTKSFEKQGQRGNGFKPNFSTPSINTSSYKIIIMRVSSTSIGVQVGGGLRAQSGEYVTILKKHGFIWHQEQSCWVGQESMLPGVRTLLLEELKKKDMGNNFQDLPELVQKYLTPMQRTFTFKSKMAEGRAEGFKIVYEPEDSHSLDHAPLDLRMKLYNFQKEGINFGIRNHGRLLIADEMGVGKTIQALGLASVYCKEWPVLILCPSSLKYNWRKEALEWLKSLITDESDIQVVWKGGEKISETAKIIIFSYDMAKSKSCAAALQLKYFQVVICDEAHNLKSVTSERSKQLVPIIQRAKRVIMLTGTPALARPAELFPILACVRPDIFFSFEQFGNRYGEPMKNNFSHKYEYKGSSCIPELNFVLKKLMIRRLKKDVLSELPAKHRQVVEIPASKEKIAEIKALTRKLEQSGKDLGSAVEHMMGGAGMIGTGSAKRDQNEDKPESTQFLMTQIYTLSSEAKKAGVLEFINELEDYKLKMIIFAFHKSMLEALEIDAKEKKIGYIRIDGSTAASDRGSLVTRFQTDPNIRYAILSITAASVGLTLTASHVVIFAELYWTPAIIFQAEDRAHRISQTSAVTCYYLLAKDTIDQAMFDMIQKKSNLTNQMLDGGEADDLNFTNATHPSRASKPVTIKDHFGSKVQPAGMLAPSLRSSVQNPSEIVTERFTLSKEQLDELDELVSLREEKQSQENQESSTITKLRDDSLEQIAEAELEGILEGVKPDSRRVISEKESVKDYEAEVPKRDSRKIEQETPSRTCSRSPWSSNNQPDASWGKSSSSQS